MAYLFTHEDKAERERLAAIEAGLDPLTIERSALGQNIDIAGQSLPTFSDRSATISLRLRDGEPRVLAGLVREDDRRTLTSLPGTHANVIPSAPFALFWIQTVALTSNVSKV